jgi:hypothetical protein
MEEECLHETETSLSLQISSDIITIIYKMNCFIYTCKPNLYVFIDSQGNFACLFLICNYKFSVGQKMFCTPWQRNPLTLSRLSCLACKGPRRQIFSRYLKE